MIISVWRFSHLALALSSFLLLTVAAITGVILSAEPVVQKAQGYQVEGWDTLSVAQGFPIWKEKLPGLTQISVNDNGFVSAKFEDLNGVEKEAYIHPLNGEVLADVPAQSAFFQWVTTLHRSLFLHDTGRAVMGVVSFLLILMAITGIALIVKRQRGFRRFFAPVERSGFAQYYHIVFGRLTVLFVLVVAATATFLSLSRFVLKPEEKNPVVNEANIREEPTIEAQSFPAFKTVKLGEVKTIQLPFSDFPEDYYTLKLKDRTLAVNQFTGEILSQEEQSTEQRLTEISMTLHTGRSSSVWAVLLGITSLYILFFIYSGLAITLQRIRGITKNKYKLRDAEIAILVGSENGSTYVFASAVQKDLLAQGKKVVVTDMNKYTVFPAIKQLLIMTSTYGEGEAPSNANKFLNLLKKYPQQHEVEVSVLGFGQRSYAQYCGFGEQVHTAIAAQSWVRLLTDFKTVDDGSLQDFQLWQEAYSEKTGTQFSLPELVREEAIRDVQELKVTHTSVPIGDSFIIRFAVEKKTSIQSGDLLAIYPASDHRKRLYSIGMVNDRVQLSVKIHQNGLGSSFLAGLQVGETIKGKIVKNEHFHLPKKADKIILVGNGTGIAPFLGMISAATKKKIILYSGFRNRSTYALYEEWIEEALQSGRLAQHHTAFSREENHQYVYHLLQRDADLIEEHLATGGIIMICGSLAMQNDVFKVLATICKKGKSFEQYKAEQKILTDCY
jgi:sulfite reductase (NADPH) flavoprotein alpha-component